MHPLLNLPATARPAKRKKIAYVVGSIVAAILVCPVLIWTGKAYLPKLWGDLHFVNFVVAWIPAVLGVLVAFVPDRELETRLRIGWRILVIACGLLYSVMLWHQQTLADESTGQAQQKLLSQAISEANKHADEQFGKMHDEVQDLNRGLDQTKKDLVGVVQDTSSALGVTIGKVTKPEPPDIPVLAFSLFTPEWRADHAIVQNFITANDEGSYPIEFTVTNRSETTARGLEIWVQLCGECSFASEPASFDHPAGSDERTRHRKLGDLNPGVSVEKTLILVRPPRGATFQVAFRYTCESCGKRGLNNQIVTLAHTYLGPPPANKRAWKLAGP